MVVSCLWKMFPVIWFMAAARPPGPKKNRTQKNLNNIWDSHARGGEMVDDTTAAAKQKRATRFSGNTGPAGRHRGRPVGPAGLGVLSWCLFFDLIDEMY